MLKLQKKNLKSYQISKIEKYFSLFLGSTSWFPYSLKMFKAAGTGVEVINQVWYLIWKWINCRSLWQFSLCTLKTNDILKNACISKLSCNFLEDVDTVLASNFGNEKLENEFEVLYLKPLSNTVLLLEGKKFQKKPFYNLD